MNRNKIDGGGAELFRIGDRVRAKKHQVIDSIGGRGTIVAWEYSSHFDREAFKVEFDSMPGSPLFMLVSELELLPSSEQFGGCKP